MSFVLGVKRVLGTGIVALGLASPAIAPAIAQEEMQPKPDQEKITVERGTTQPAGEMRQVTVTVKEVDAENHKVTFEAQVNPEAGGEVRIDRLQEGQQVRATFDPATGEITAIEALGAPPAEPADPSQPAEPMEPIDPAEPMME